MRKGERTTATGRVLVAHALHACLLLIPTWALAGWRGIDWTIGCFVLAITAAGFLESRLLAAEVSAADTTVHDKAAIRVASIVGFCLLADFWSAQIERQLHGPGALGVQVLGVRVLGVQVLGVQVLGGVLLVSGMALRVEAIRALGSQFVSDIRVGRKIVRDGIYAWSRHPSEIGLLLIAVGAPLLIGSMLTACAAALVLLPASLWRTVREDAALAASGPARQQEARSRFQGVDPPPRTNPGATL